MKRLILCFLLGAVIGLTIAYFYNSNKPIIHRPSPTVVGYRQAIKKTDDYTVYRDCEYQLVDVKYDTIQNRTLSTIETPSLKTHSVPDQVDLNEIFDPNGEGETNWNFTEIDEEDIRYLDEMGVYWDEQYGCYRKHK